MSCKKCESPYVVNKHFGLCRRCNSERLSSNKKPKRYTFTKNKNKPLKSPENGFEINSRTLKKIKEDEDFYEKCFNMSNHKCEECNVDLPKKFRNEDGRVIARWRYSHIVPKSIASHLRHKVENINHLCIKCHGIWENGDKHLMKIFSKNYALFPEFLKRWKSRL